MGKLSRGSKGRPPDRTDVLRADSGNPYPGPGPYERNDKRFYVGRVEEGEELVSLLISRGVVLFHALSGIGKSSLVNKRVIPALEAKRYHVFPVARVYSPLPTRVLQQPDVNPYVLSILSKLSPDPLELLSRLSLLRWLQEWRQSPNNRTSRVVLVVDQFEELLTSFAQHFAKREELFKELGAALKSDPLLSVLLVAKEEFAARLERGREFLPERRLGSFTIDPLKHEDALEAVKQPAALAEPPREFDDRAARYVVANVSQISVEEEEIPTGGEYVEPLILQVVCHETWEKFKQEDPEGRVIYEKDVPDPTEALQRFYDRTVRAVAADRTVNRLGISEATLRRWIGDALIRGNRFRSQVLRDAHHTEGMRNEAVDLLEAQHLLRAQRERGGQWYELVHDRFIEPIVKSNDEFLPFRLKQLRLAAQAWDRAGRPKDLLYHAEKLRHAKEWLKESSIDPGGLVNSFLQQAQVTEDDKSVLLRRLSVALSISIVLLAIGAVIMWRLFNERQHGLRARTLAVSSLDTVKTDPERSLLLAYEAARLNHETRIPLEIKEALNSSLQENRLGLLIDGVLRPNDKGQAAQPMDEVRSVAFLSDGRELATWGRDGLLLVWDSITGEELPRKGFRTEGRVQVGVLGTPFAMSKDVVAIAGDSGSVKVQAGHNNGSWTVPLVHGTVHAVALSPDGGQLMLVGSNGLASLWDVQRRTPVLKSLELTSDVYATAFDSTGDMIATGGADGFVRLWNKQGHLQQSLPCKTQSQSLDIYSLSFNRDGSRIAAAGKDGVRLWDVKSCTLLAFRRVDQSVIPGPLYTLSFSPDGRHFATAGLDGLIQIWDSNDNDFVLDFTLVGHRSAVYSLSFSPDGRRLVSGGADKTARIWNVESEKFSSNELSVDSAGRRVATVSDLITADAHTPSCRETPRSDQKANSTLTIWDTEKNADPVRFQCSSFRAPTFSMDGRRIVAATSKSVHSFGSTGFRIDSFEEPYVYQVSLSRDGRKVATLSPSRVRLWNEFQDKPLFELGGVSVRTIALSPDGQLLATGGINGELNLYDRAAAKERSFNTGTYAVAAISFSTEGKPEDKPKGIIAVGSDGTVGLWDLASGKLVRTQQAAALKDREVYEVRSNKSNQYLAVASQTGAVVWDQTLEGQPPRSIGSTGPIRSVAFTEDDHLVTLGADGRLHELILGDVELRQNALTRLTRGFKGEECEIPGSCSPFEQSVEHLANAQRLSRAGELERAIGEFKSAKDLSGEQEWDFSDEARLIRSSSLLNKARFELGQQNLLETVRLVKAAQAVHSIGERQLGWFTSHLVEMGQRVARRAGFQPEFNVRKEEVGLAAQAYSAAGELDPSIFSRSNSEAVSELNNLCWFGTVAGLAADVMRFCDEAIAVSARNNGPALDTHGVARACIGDVEAAKADFTDFVRLIGDEKLRKERLSWIELVEAKKLCTDQFLLEQRGSY